jgi:hypothetical protein
MGSALFTCVPSVGIVWQPRKHVGKYFSFLALSLVFLSNIYAEKFIQMFERRRGNRLGDSWDVITSTVHLVLIKSFQQLLLT